MINQILEDRLSIDGRLEAVQLVGAINADVLRGILKGVSCYVYAPQNYVGKECLVRFSYKYKDRKKVLSANFINSVIPKDFVGLSNEGYILLGLWKEDMKKKSRLPDINEINEYYDPGNITFLYYLIKGSIYNRGRFRIWNDGDIEPRKQTFSYIVRRGFFPNKRASRIVISESMDQLEALSNIAKENGIAPILMEPRI